MKTLMMVILLFSTALPGARAEELTGLAAEAFAAETALWQAEVEGDVGAFAARLDDDIVQVTTSTGTEVSILIGKESAVASIDLALESMEFGAFELEPAHARVLGETVVLTFRFRQVYVSRSDETPLHVQGVATSVWVRDASAGWQNVHFHWHSQAVN